MFGKSRGGYIPRDVVEHLTGVECDNQDAGIFPARISVQPRKVGYCVRSIASKASTICESAAQSVIFCNGRCLMMACMLVVPLNSP